MKKILLVVFLIISTSTIFAQSNSKYLAIDLRYPIPIGDNFINKNIYGDYIGLVDIGIDYNLFKFKKFGFGILVNASALGLSKNFIILTIISPKIKLDYEINIGKISLMPNIAAGYSNWQFTGLANTYTEPLQSGKFNENRNGITFKGAMKAVINSNNQLNWFVQLAYEFTKLDNPDSAKEDLKYNRDIQILYPEIGVIWKLN